MENIDAVADNKWVSIIEKFEKYFSKTKRTYKDANGKDSVQYRVNIDSKDWVLGLFKGILCNVHDCGGENFNYYNLYAESRVIPFEMLKGCRLLHVTEDRTKKYHVVVIRAYGHEYIQLKVTTLSGDERFNIWKE